MQGVWVSVFVMLYSSRPAVFQIDRQFFYSGFAFFVADIPEGYVLPACQLYVLQWLPDVSTGSRGLYSEVWRGLQWWALDVSTRGIPCLVGARAGAGGRVSHVDCLDGGWDSEGLYSEVQCIMSNGHMVIIRVDRMTDRHYENITFLKLRWRAVIKRL